MYDQFCDVCRHPTSKHDTERVTINYRAFPYHLCGSCAGGIVLMMRDMRLLDDEVVIEA